METIAIATGFIGLVVGFVLGRRSVRRPITRIIRTDVLASFPADAEMEALVRQGKKIHAIKRHRELHGTDLEEAKYAIDALEARLDGGDAPSR